MEIVKIYCHGIRKVLLIMQKLIFIDSAHIMSVKNTANLGLHVWQGLFSNTNNLGHVFMPFKHVI